MKKNQIPEIEILTIIWDDCMQNKIHTAKNWELFLQVLFRYGIGMEATMQYIYLTKPNITEFLQWIVDNTQKPLEENIVDASWCLSESDLLFWKENGYIVIKNAISKEDCSATQNAIAEFLKIRLQDSSTWYTEHAAMEGLMVLFTKHATLEKNRASSKIKTAYEQLYGHQQLYKTIDKVSFNPPETTIYKFQGSPLHWDVSLQLPIPSKFQGLLYLTDVPTHGGAFQCVPGFHNSIGDWLSALPKDADPRRVAIDALKPITIPGNAGDFIIWHQALPHGATPNKHTHPRMVQYLTYLPTEISTDHEEWK